MVDGSAEGLFDLARPGIVGSVGRLTVRMVFSEDRVQRFPVFVTNVPAILGVRTLVMVLHGVHRMKLRVGSPKSRALNRRNAVGVIAVLVVLVAMRLTTASVTNARQTNSESAVTPAFSEVGEGDWVGTC